MSRDDEKMVAELRARGDALSLRAAERFLTYAKLDTEAAEYVESVICMRTGFTGDPPYVGWKGLGLALNEALDERDAAKASYKPRAIDPGFDDAEPWPHEWKLRALRAEKQLSEMQAKA